MKRSPLERWPRRKANPLAPADVAARELWARDLGGCVVCPAEGGSCAGPVQGHHAIAKQTLKRRGLQRFLWDVRNRVPVCEHRHEQHTTGYRPIPRSSLPAAVFEFAQELELGWYLDRHYPEGLVAA